MTAFEALRKGWEIVPRFIFLMAIVLVFNLVSGGILLGVMGVAPTADKINQVAGTVVGLLIVMMAGWVYLEGGIFSCIQSELKTGQSSLESFTSDGAKFFLRLLVISILAGIIAMGIWLIGALFTGIIVTLGSNKNIFFNILGAIIMGISVITSIIISIPLLSAHYIAVTEDIGPIAAFKKGFILFRNFMGRLILLFFLLGVIFVAISSVVNLVGVLLTKMIGPGIVVAVINLVLTSVVNAAIGIFSSCAIMPMILSLSNTGPDTVTIETPAA